MSLWEKATTQRREGIVKLITVYDVGKMEKNGTRQAIHDTRGEKEESGAKSIRIGSASSHEGKRGKESR